MANVCTAGANLRLVKVRSHVSQNPAARRSLSARQFREIDTAAPRSAKVDRFFFQ